MATVCRSIRREAKTRDIPVKAFVRRLAASVDPLNRVRAAAWRVAKRKARG